jgi:NADH-quinone oxidoreductase subunit C
MLPALDHLKSLIETAVPGAAVEIVRNDCPAGPDSLLVNREAARAVASFLCTDPELRLDYASNVTGIDWLDTVTKEKIKAKKVIDGLEKEVEETVERKRPGYLEAVYHLYSIAQKHGPVVLRMRTGDREADVHLPSLTPVWRGAELQEREIYDLYGILFEGHPDLRRILMWDGYTDHPMRKDYVEPDDYEYEPTPHDDVLAKTKCHWPSTEGTTGRA